jgi:hypothetical protein
MNKQQMQQEWDEPGVQYSDCFTRWNEWGRASRGLAAKLSPGEQALAFRREVLYGHGVPHWPKSRPYANHEWPLSPPADYVARVKADCPNNAKAILASYGQTRTKYDAWNGQELFHVRIPDNAPYDPDCEYRDGGRWRMCDWRSAKAWSLRAGAV